MKSHRVIWSIAGFVVLVAALSVIVRDARAPAATGTLQPMADVVSHLNDAQSQILIDAMKACLEKDPQARRPNTRLLVEGVAHLAESGVLENADTYYALGVMRSGERDFQGAEAAFRKAVTLRPDWKWGFNQLGIVLHAMGRPEEWRNVPQGNRDRSELGPRAQRSRDIVALDGPDGRCRGGSETIA